MLFFRPSLSSNYNLQFTRPLHPVHEVSEYYDDLVQRIGSIGGQMGETAKQRVGRLTCANPEKTLESCDGKKIPPRVREQQETLKKANADDAAYQTALAAALKKIACTNSDDAIYILRGLARNYRVEATGSERIGLVDFIQSEDCPVSASLPKEYKAEFLKIRGFAYEDKRDYEHAIADYSRSIELLPIAEAYKTRGNAYVSNRDFDPAIADYSKMIELAPEDASAYNSRGTAYASKPEYDRAIEDFTKVIELTPTAAAYDTRGNAYANKGDYDRAIADYNEAITLNPKYADAFIDRGDAYANKGDYDRAMGDYNEAIRLDPNEATFSRRGIAYAKKNDYGRAIADYKEAIRREPTDAYPVLWLYLARTRSGAHNAAAELETNKKKLKPQDWPYPVVQMFLGHRTPETIRTTAATPGERCEAEFYAGEWYLLQGAHPKAIEALKAAAEHCPKDFNEYGFARAELRRLQP